MADSDDSSTDDSADSDETSAPDWASWPSPWNGVSAKLVHAWRHFTLLASLAQDFVNPPPLRTESMAAPELGPNWLRFDLLVTHPDDEISLTLGDFLHNLRCALDHSLTAIDARAGRKLNFPTALTEAEFDGWAPGWTKAGGSAGALSAIRSRQPFLARDGEDPEDFVLRIVSRLNNTDKHRLLNTTPLGLSDDTPPELVVESTAHVVDHHHLLAGGWPLEERQPALYVEFDAPAAQVKAKLSGTVRIGVSVERYGDVVYLGNYLHTGVRRTCRMLRQGYLNDWEQESRGG